MPLLVTRQSRLRLSNGRKMGCLPRRSLPGERACLPLFRDHYTLTPRAERREVSYRHLIYHTFDQDGVGSCTCNMTCMAAMVAREIQGLQRIVLSPGNLYNRVCGGRDQGSALDDALEELIKNGVCSVDVQAPNDWRTLASGWQADAANYRGLESLDLDGSEDGLYTALDKGFVVGIGVNWPGGGGHAILVTGCRKRSNGAWEAEIKNSWGADWGDDGYGYLTASTLRTMPQFGCFAVRVMTSTESFSQQR